MPLSEVEKHLTRLRGGTGNPTRLLFATVSRARLPRRIFTGRCYKRFRLQYSVCTQVFAFFGGLGILLPLSSVVVLAPPTVATSADLLVQRRNGR